MTNEQADKERDIREAHTLINQQYHLYNASYGYHTLVEGYQDLKQAKLHGAVLHARSAERYQIWRMDDGAHRAPEQGILVWDTRDDHTDTDDSDAF